VVEVIRVKDQAAVDAFSLAGANPEWLQAEAAIPHQEPAGPYPSDRQERCYGADCTNLA